MKVNLFNTQTNSRTQTGKNNSQPLRQVSFGRFSLFKKQPEVTVDKLYQVAEETLKKGKLPEELNYQFYRASATVKNAFAKLMNDDTHLTKQYGDQAVELKKLVGNLVNINA
jgi:hypothetical protein